MRVMKIKQTRKLFNRDIFRVIAAQKLHSCDRFGDIEHVDTRSAFYCFMHYPAERTPVQRRHRKLLFLEELRNCRHGQEQAIGLGRQRNEIMF